MSTTHHPSQSASWQLVVESPQATLIKIADVSQKLYQALSDANRDVWGANDPDISGALFLLDKVMATSGEILETLNQCTINDSAPDEQLEGWISANGPVICLVALNDVKRTIGIDRPWRPLAFFGFKRSFSPAPANDKIHEAIKVLHTYREYFDFLLASGVR